MLMRRLFMAGVIISLILSIPAYGFAAADSQPAIMLDGTKIEAAAYIDAGNVYLPLRAVGEALGYEVQWSGKDNTISVSMPGTNITIDLENYKVTANDHVSYMGGDYTNINGSIYMGADFFSGNFGLEIRDSQNGMVQLERVTENAISIKTIKEASESDIIKITLQYPQIGGLTDKTVQDSINSIFRESAMEARNEGLKNADEKEKANALGYGSPNKYETYFDYSLKYNQNGLLSIVFRNYQYTGGAHGLTVQSSRTVDLKTGGEYKLKDLVKVDADYVALINDTVRNMIDERVKEGILPEDPIAPFNTIRDDHDFYLSNNAVVVYFQQYEHWPYAAGIQEFPVEFTVLSDMLKPEFSFLNDSIVIGDNYTLVERGTSGERDYYLNHPSFNEMKHIVSFIETAEFKEYKDGELWFTARGGSDTGNYEFPYLLAYNPNTEELRREELFLPLNEKEDIAFGKDGWKQVLNNIEIRYEAVVFEFKPAAGEILAGGRRLPYTTVRYDEQSNDLEFSFLNVELSDSLKEKAIIAGPGLKYVKEVRIEGLPGVDQNPAQDPLVRARITLNGKPLYNVASHPGGSVFEGMDSYTVRFK